MSGALRWASRHAGTVVAVLLALAVATAASVARCSAVHAPEAGAEATPEDEADALLPESVRALRSDHDATSDEALALMSANAWVDGQGTTVVRFTPRAACVRAPGGSEEWVAFAIAASDRQAPAGGPAVTTLCLVGDGWREMARLVVPQAAEAGAPAPAPTLACRRLCGGAELTLSAGLKEVVADGPDPAVLSAHGTSPELVGRALAAWCADWRPTATSATWGQVIVEDHAARKWRLPYALDDARGSSVVVSIGMDDGDIEVEEGSL